MFQNIDLKCKWVGNGTIIPIKYQTNGSSGIDLPANVPTIITILPNQTLKIPTGWSFAIPVNCEGQVRPRSGLSLKKNLVAIFGTIDNDYRGEVNVLLHNCGIYANTIEPGQRIAQLVICPVYKAIIDVVKKLPETDRGENGFGSTGV